MRFFSIFFIFLFFSFQSHSRNVSDSFADLVEKLVPAVVSIASTTIVDEEKEQLIPRFPQFPNYSGDDQLKIFLTQKVEI